MAVSCGQILLRRLAASVTGGRGEKSLETGDSESTGLHAVLAVRSLSSISQAWSMV